MAENKKNKKDDQEVSPKKVEAEVNETFREITEIVKKHGGDVKNLTESIKRAFVSSQAAKKTGQPPGPTQSTLANYLPGSPISKEAKERITRLMKLDQQK